MPSESHAELVAREDPVYYPVLLDLRGRRVVVIGGGAVATAKVRGLLDVGAHVTVVSPTLSEALVRLGESGEIEVIERHYRPGDLSGAMLAIAATDDPVVHHAVWQEAETQHVLLNAVDDVAHCHFIAPSVLRRGGVVVSVSSSGKSPALAVRLRERIESLVRPEHGLLAELLGGLRDEVALRVPASAERTAVWYEIVDRLLEEPELRANSTDEVNALRRRIRTMLPQSSSRVDALDEHNDSQVGSRGSVHLVGAGPGDPGLLTLRGLELLRTADVVVHDRLVSAEVLALARSGARLIDVGKTGRAPSPSQASITATLIAEARKGNRVVRLKGGDPFVFGRGGEELEAVRRADLPCEIVSGVSAAIAAPAAAGIPVTHRECASAFAVVTAERDEAAGGPDLDWAALARMPTLVVLMGLRALSACAERLMSHGASPEVPAAVISAATTPAQRVVCARLGEIAAAAREARLQAPATLIVGEVVRRSSRFANQAHYIGTDTGADACGCRSAAHGIVK